MRQLDRFVKAATVTVAGHFGELLQGRVGPTGVVALVTLPCRALTVSARIATSAVPHGPLSPARARILREELGLGDPGPVQLSATMPRGGGAGASTAALVAYARLAGSHHPAADLARACVAVEGASDPLMFANPDRLLWASRRAEVLQDLPKLPPFDVLGGFFGPNRRTNPADTGFADISDLIGPWVQAATCQDLPALAALASQSATRNLALRGPLPDPTAQLARATNALGYAIAHTGSARGLLFAPGTIPPDAAAHLARQGFRRIISFRAGG
ncbi:MAG: propanediol utilization protein [Albidovulum sp.]